MQAVDVRSNFKKRHVKKILTYILTISFSLGIYSQSNKVDSLIVELNNNQLYGTCNYIWVLKMEKEPAESIVEFGKSVSKKLIPLLENQEKGIIAHCVLSRIWFDDFNISTSFENFDEKGIVEYTYNGLRFYEKDGKMIADENDLAENKKKWIEIIGK
jgi:hypothetical protein